MELASRRTSGISYTWFYRVSEDHGPTRESILGDRTRPQLIEILFIFYKPLEDGPIFPPMVTRMIAVGDGGY
jgi:hypothetical protein